MDTIDRNDVKKLVEVFYQPPFKTFYVNSSDGYTFCQPFGVFVSLGITTSMKVLQNICDIINNSKDYSSRLVELSSIKVSGQFLNSINSENPTQIKIENLEDGKIYQCLRDGETILDASMAREDLEKMKDLMYPDQDIKILQEYAPKIGSLEELINQIESDPNGWENYWILKKTPSNTYKLFYRNINYVNCGDVDYRVGIFVTPKNK